MQSIRFRPLPTPNSLKRQLPLAPELHAQIIRHRETIQNILRGQDPRLLVVVGPCSIHDPEAAMDYAARLKALSQAHGEQLFIMMRVYNEKPRTKLGWKGFIYDPRLDDSYRVQQGLFKTRELLLAINELGLPAGTEFLDPMTPRYIGDLISWAAIGARTSESPVHRSMASGLPMPVGFKNATTGNIQVAIDGVLTAQTMQHYFGFDDQGRPCLVETSGNPFCHIILRGGDTGPNYEHSFIENAASLMAQAGLQTSVMVDCSHGNSNKNFKRQEAVFEKVAEELAMTRPWIRGIMLESHLKSGQQTLRFGEPLDYGQSITDPCMGWDTTQSCLEQLAETVIS